MAAIADGFVEGEAEQVIDLPNLVLLAERHVDVPAGGEFLSRHGPYLRPAPGVKVLRQNAFLEGTARNRVQTAQPELFGDEHRGRRSRESSEHLNDVKQFSLGHSRAIYECRGHLNGQARLLDSFRRPFAVQPIQIPDLGLKKLERVEYPKLFTVVLDQYRGSLDVL